MSLSEQDGITTETERKDIIGGESSRPHVVAEIVQEAQLQVRDFGQKRGKHTTGHRYRIIPPRTSTIVRWIAGSGKLRKTLCACKGGESTGEKEQERQDEQNPLTKNADPFITYPLTSKPLRSHIK